jgi:membrane associated rhomboid family serine protease
MITYIVIAITAITSYLAFQNSAMFEKMMFNAVRIVHRKEYYRLLSHGFVHADWNHLIFNMITLFFFGRPLEKYLNFYFEQKGAFIFLLLYFGGMVVSNIWAIMKHRNNSRYNAVGASGAVASVLFAYILFDPLNLILVFFVPMPGIVFAVGYLIYEWYMGRQNKGNIAHDAHILGSAFGFVCLILLKPSLVNSFIERLTSVF